MLHECFVSPLMMSRLSENAFLPSSPEFTKRFLFTGMPARQIQSVQQVLLFVTICILVLAGPAASLCDERCEKANPRLYRLKAIWTRSYTGETVNFDEFIQYLITAAGSNGRLSPLRDTLYRMIAQYRDCVMACEHAFSKRSIPQYNSNQRSQLCQLLSSNGPHINDVFFELLSRYCFSRTT